MRTFVSLFFQKALTISSLVLHCHWLQAQSSFVSSFGSKHYGMSVLKTYDGGYAFCGGFNPSSSLTNRNRILIGKTDSSGNLQWMKSFSTNDMNYTNSIVQTADSGLVVSGTSQPYNSNYQQDVFIMKVNSQGDSLWGQTIGNPGTQSEYANHMIKTKDGSLVTIGTSAPAVLNYLYMTKTSPNGTKRIARQVVNSWFGVNGYRALESMDNNYLFAAGQADPTRYLIIAKTDTAGNAIWAKRYRKISSTTGVMPECIIQLADSTIVLATTINYNPNNNLSDTWVVKCKSNGDTLSSWTFPQMRTSSIIPNKDGSFTLCGSSPGFSPVGRLVRISADGQTIVWEKTYSFYPQLRLEDAIPLADKGFLMIGSGSVTSDLRVILIRTDSLGVTLEPTGVEEQNNASDILAFPNPTKGKLFVRQGNRKIETIRISDLLGKEVFHSCNNETSFTIELRLNNLPKGIYRMKIEGKQFMATQNLVLE